MARKIREIDLDLQKDVLEGWEKFYDILNVKVLREARRLGHILPAADVVRENGIYRLVFGRGPDWIETGIYGGHSRAVAAFQDKLLLRCLIYDEHWSNPREVSYLPISQMQGKIKDNMFRLSENLKFLPREVAERFVAENDLVLLEDGEVITRENFENPLPF